MLEKFLTIFFFILLVVIHSIGHIKQWLDWLTWKTMKYIEWILSLLRDVELPPHQWPWHSIFKIIFWISRISGIGGPINIARKTIGCWTHCVTLSLKFELVLSRSNSEIAVSQEWDAQLTWNERYVNLILCWNHYATLAFTSPMTNLKLPGQIFK